MEYKKEELISGNTYNLENDKDKFIKEYAESKGWDLEKLNKDQLKEIKSQDGYKNPNMLLS